MNIQTSESSTQLLNKIEFQDYLIFERASREEASSGTMNEFITPKKTKQNIDDIKIPERSPRRPIKKNNMNYTAMVGKQNVSASPCSVLDSSSFEYRNDDSEKSSNESIFSNEEIIEVNNNDIMLDEFGLNLEGIEVEEFLNEFSVDENGQSDIIFEVDNVINIVAIHTASNAMPISHIDVN